MVGWDGYSAVGARHVVLMDPDSKSIPELQSESESPCAENDVEGGSKISVSAQELEELETSGAALAHSVNVV